MNDYKKEMQEFLLETSKREEKQNKKLLLSMYTILIISMIFYSIILMITVLFIPEESKQIIVVAISTSILLISAFIALKFEVDAGYYECKNCHHRFVPKYRQVLLAIHIGTTRYLKCPKCNKKSWSKKVMSK